MMKMCESSPRRQRGRNWQWCAIWPGNETGQADMMDPGMEQFEPRKKISSEMSAVVRRQRRTQHDLCCSRAMRQNRRGETPLASLLFVGFAFSLTIARRDAKRAAQTGEL